MELIVTEPAAEFVRAHDNRVYVWTRARRCCGGGQTLEAALDPPDEREFRPVVNAAGIELFLPTRLRRLPDELHVDLQGRPQRLRAYWDGCVWVV